MSNKIHSDFLEELKHWALAKDIAKPQNSQENAMSPSADSMRQVLEEIVDVEPLAKGSLQRKMTFNPQSVSDEHRMPVEQWISGGADADRDIIPKIDENAKFRGMNKLHSRTEVRKHPKTGERIFLLHRGMGREEHSSIMTNKGNKELSSWTPDYSVAHGFSQDYNYDESTGRIPKKTISKVLSAWIPESQIHNIPNAIGSKDPSAKGNDPEWDSDSKVRSPARRSEHEVIVKPHNLTFANYTPTKGGLHTSISTRGELSNVKLENKKLVDGQYVYRPQNSQPKKMAASENNVIEPLIKSPLHNGPGLSEGMGSEPVKRPPPFLKHAYTKELYNGLYHHMFENKDSGAVSHTISENRNPDRQHLAEIAGHQDPESPKMTVGTARVSSQYKGMGYGKLAYLAALHHHNRIESDSSTTAQADNAWKSLKEGSGGAAHIRLSPKDTQDPHVAYVLNKHKSILTEKLYGKQIEKSEIGNALKGGLAVIGLMHAAHYIGSGPDQKQVTYQEPAPQESSVEAVKPDTSPKDFLRAISQVESSGGKNTDHKLIHSGIHAGNKAMGSYGFMPHTIKEMAQRADKLNQLPPELSGYKDATPVKMNEMLSKNPHHETFFANFLANHLLKRFDGDHEKAAYAWNQGHNTPSYKFDINDYKKHPYVKKFRKALYQTSTPAISQKENIPTKE